MYRRRPRLGRPASHTSSSSFAFSSFFAFVARSDAAVPECLPTSPSRSMPNRMIRPAPKWSAANTALSPSVNPPRFLMRPTGPAWVVPMHARNFLTWCSMCMLSPWACAIMTAPRLEASAWHSTSPSRSVTMTCGMMPRSARGPAAVSAAIRTAEPACLAMVSNDPSREGPAPATITVLPLIILRSAGYASGMPTPSSMRSSMRALLSSLAVSYAKSASIAPYMSRHAVTAVVAVAAAASSIIASHGSIMPCVDKPL